MIGATLRRAAIIGAICLVGFIAVVTIAVFGGVGGSGASIPSACGPDGQTIEVSDTSPGGGPAAAGFGEQGDPTRGISSATTGGQGGDWGGTMQRALDWALVSGITPGSQKRGTVKTASGNTSDHWLGRTDAYAVDLPIGVPAGDPIAARLGEAIGLTNYQGGSWENRTIGGYRYQIGWRVPDHYDHIHIGVRRVGDPDTPAPAQAVTTTPRTTPIAARGGGDAAGIDAYLRGKGSPLAGLGEHFVSEGERTAIDPRFVVAIACHETVCGTYGPSQPIHNAFGLGPGMNFPTWEAGITYAFNNLAGNLYRGDRRLTIPAIGSRWAPVGAANDPGSLNQHWESGVSRYLRELGGDPTQPVMAPAAGSGAAWVSVSAGSSAECTPAALDASAAGDNATAVVEWARKQLGLPYVWGANHGANLATMRQGQPPTRGFDCSSLLAWAYAVGANLYIGDVTYTQWEAGDGRDPNVTRGRDGAPPGGWRAGDLIFRRYSSPERPEHVLMAISATQLIHAPQTGDVVKIEAIPSDLSGYGWVRYSQLGNGATPVTTGGDVDA